MPKKSKDKKKTVMNKNKNSNKNKISIVINNQKKTTKRVYKSKKQPQQQTPQSIVVHSNPQPVYIQQPTMFEQQEQKPFVKTMIEEKPLIQESIKPIIKRIKKYNRIEPTIKDLKQQYKDITGSEMNPKITKKTEVLMEWSKAKTNLIPVAEAVSEPLIRKKFNIIKTPKESLFNEDDNKKPFSEDNNLKTGDYFK